MCVSIARSRTAKHRNQARNHTLERLIVSKIIHLIIISSDCRTHAEGSAAVQLTAKQSTNERGKGERIFIVHYLRRRLPPRRPPPPPPPLSMGGNLEPPPPPPPLSSTDRDLCLLCLDDCLEEGEGSLWRRRRCRRRRRSSSSSS